MFGDPFEIRDELKTGNKSAPNPFGRLSEDNESDIEIEDIKNPTELASSVGDSGQNGRRDVAKTEQLLGNAGTLDLKKTDGPTGYWGTRTSDATKAFQKQNGLKVDGQINPNGETIRALGKLAGQAVKAVQSSNDRSSGARGAKTNSNVVIPAKAGTQSNVFTNWVPDQVRADNTVDMTDDAFMENQRAARYLASRDGIGEFSKFVTDGIETDGDKAVAETVDLYRQTAEMNQDQADALIKKVIPGLSPENAKRLHSAIMPGEHDQMNEILRERIPRMDEHGGWFGVAGNSIPSLNADPRVLKAAASSIPVPGMPVLPGGIDPATPEDIDKALENASKDVRKAWNALKDATGITDADLFNTPLGKTLLMGELTKQGLGKVMDGAPRTDIADPQSPVPGFPSEPGLDLPHQTEGRSTEPDRVIDPPEFVPPPTGAEVGNPPFPDQSDDPDINGAGILEIKPLKNPIDLSKGKPPQEVLNANDHLTDDEIEFLNKHAYSNGIMNGAGEFASNTHVHRSAHELDADWEAAIRDKGGNPNGPDIEPLGNGGVKFEAKDGTVIIKRVSDKNGPTLDFHPRKNPRLPKKHHVKRRYLLE